MPCLRTYSATFSEKTGAYYKLRSGIYGADCLFFVYNRSRPDVHFGKQFCSEFYRLFRASGSECNLRAVYPARSQRGERFLGFVYVFNHHYGYYSIHSKPLLCCNMLYFLRVLNAAELTLRNVPKCSYKII